MNQAIKWLFVITMFLGSMLPQGYSDKTAECTSPVGKNGLCKPLQECRSIAKLLPLEPIKSPDILGFLNASRCSVPDVKNSIPLFCCPMERIPKLPNCGIGETFRLIGGQSVFLSEFAWTAVVEYRHRVEGSIRPHCGATLVSPRYVLTAAHCIPSDTDDWKAVSVRLGEHDLSTSPDCENEMCADTPITAGIEKIVVHEGYDPLSKGRYDDIALVRLDREIEFGLDVLPVCLPFGESDRTRNITGEWEAKSIGWGLSRSANASNEKLKVKLNILDRKQCSDLDGVILRETQFCTKIRNNKDICSADSGGSLILRESKHHMANILYGIASYGKSGLCGTKEETAVFTDVTKYVDWIDNNIEL